ncbi:head GIN domain-containing protein [Polaribacter sp. Asnod6-C07]|uniref:head GIN domain-containing protein n=1 Tax=Polaribacter sp. Asnod6-C07 TaxID=3160582 RepID=UPI00386E5951
MKKIIFICVLMMSLSFVAQSTVNKKLGDFSTLKVYNGIELELIKSNESKIEITGLKSEKVKIKNVNNTLKISLPFSLKPENNAANGEVLVKLYYSKSIDTIDANEGATITGKEINQNHLEVKSQERAFVNLVVKVKHLEVKTSSGGIIKLSGTTKNQTVDVDLYGIYNGFDLKATANSTVKAGTGAKAEILAGETLNAKVSFGGSIFYKGNPEVLKDKKVIGGIIQKRD